MLLRSNGSTLLWLLTRQELVARFRGSVFGTLWLVLTPMLMLAVYFLVFGEVLRAKWPGTDASRKDLFALNLFAGLVVFQLFADAVARSPTAITSQPNYVKKVVFPLEMLPLTLVLASAVTALISFALLLVFAAVATNSLPVGALWAPVVLGPVLLLAWGASLLLASLGVFLRDLSQVVGVVLSALMFLSPVFFPLSQVPVAYQWLFDLNPMALPIEQLRRTLIGGLAPDAWGLAKAWAGAALVLWLGMWWFGKTKRSFADAL
jgi:lipopolysaccharide transport system permease protein